MRTTTHKRDPGQRIYRRTLLKTGGAAGLGLAGAACARGGTPSPKATSSGNASAAPKAGGKLTLSSTADPPDWDTTFFADTSATSSYGLGWAYESLLTFKSGPDVPYGHLLIQPKLAVSWETPNSQDYIFHLRQGVKFANLPPVNGRALTSADVKWNWEYQARTGQFAKTKLPTSEYNWWFEGLASVETPDPYTAVAHFSQPFIPFPSYMAVSYSTIAPHEIADQDGDLRGRIVGSGPWQLDTAASEKGSRWNFQRNPTYWQAGKPYIDAVQVLIIPDLSSATAAFAVKQIDWIGAGLSSTQATQLKGTVPTATALVNSFGSLHLYFNLRRSPLNDVRVRQAISYAIDREEFIRTFSGGDGKWVLPGAFPDDFTQDEIKQLVPYDPQRAKQLVSAAGYGNGLSLTSMYADDSGETVVQQQQLLQAQLKKVGVDITLQPVDGATRVGNLKTGNFTMNLTGKDIEGDVDSYLGAVFRTGAGYNFGGSSDPKLDALIDSERREVDVAKRRDIVRQAVTYIVETAQAAAVFSPAIYEFYYPRLHNYYPQAFVRALPSVDGWLES